MDVDSNLPSCALAAPRRAVAAISTELRAGRILALGCSESGKNPQNPTVFISVLRRADFRMRLRAAAQFTGGISFAGESARTWFASWRELDRSWPDIIQSLGCRALSFLSSHGSNIVAEN